jgi:hypothetical protein
VDQAGVAAARIHTERGVDFRTWSALLAQRQLYSFAQKTPPKIMSEAQNLSWSLEAERTCRVRSPWWELVWHPVRGLTEVAFASGGTPATQGLVAPEPGNREAKPAQAVSGGAWKAPAILGLSQLRIGDRCWQLADLPTAEIVIQENRVTASWPARSRLPGRTSRTLGPRSLPVLAGSFPADPGSGCRPGAGDRQRSGFVRCFRDA